MKITEIHHPEQLQALKDQEFVRAEIEFVQMQELFEEMERERKPANIIFEELEEYQEFEEQML